MMILSLETDTFFIITDAMKQYVSEADVEHVEAVEENALYRSDAAPYTDEASGPSERTILLDRGQSWANGLTNKPIPVSIIPGSSLRL
jgi:hypothetical protein